MSKNRYKRIISIIIMVILSINLFNGMKIPVMAETFRGTCGENLVWELDDSTGVLTISGSGEMYDYDNPSSPLTKVEDYPGWIQTGKTVKKVIVYEGVTSIGNYAFSLRRSVDEVILPKSLERIGVKAFYDNRSLAKISLPDSVSIIEESAFEGCSALKTIEIPSSVEKIGNYCFLGTGVEEVILNEGLKEIGYSAFKGTNIKKIIIPDSVETLGGSVFGYCEELEYIKIGKNLTNMSTSYYGYGDNFVKCPLLKTAGPNDSYNIHYTWETEIPDNAFYKADRLELVDIASNIKEIGKGVFADCSSLKTVNFSSGLQTIGASAFIRCKNLDDFVLNPSLESIGDYAFISMGETEIIIPQSVNEIGNAAIGYIATYEGKDSHLVPVKKEGYIIRGYSGSVAEKYASENNIQFERIDKDVNIPIGSITSTNNISSMQTVTLTMKDDVGIEGYYWGTNSNYSSNTYTSTSLSSVTKTVSSSGTYYLTVKDTSGNISDTVSATFYKTILNVGGGTVNPSYVITKSGNSITLPIPTRSGYTFNGWSTSSSATSGSVTSITPTSNSTYYATWKSTANQFEWNVDNWNFNNSSLQGYFLSSAYINHIDDSYLNILKDNLTNSEYRAIFNTSSGWIYDKFGGSCYGMSSTTLLANSGLLPYSLYKTGATNLYQLSYPAADKNISSLITYYQMLQVKDVIQQQYRTVPNKSNEENIKNIISLLEKNNTVLIGFKKNGWGGHAILAYGYEYGSYTWNGVSYQGCIKICDPNSSKAYNNQCNIYFNTSTYNWTIPYYSSVPITSVTGAKFNYIGADIDEINYGGYLSGTATVNVDNYVARLDAVAVSDNRSVVKVDEYEGNYITKNNSSDDIVEDYSFILGGESEGTVGYTLYDSSSAYKLIQHQSEKLKLSMSYEDCYLEGGSEAGKSVIFDKKGVVYVEGESSDYNISMTYNSGYPTDWFTIEVSGASANNIKLEKKENGYILSGDNLERVKVNANNREDFAYTSFSTTYKQVYLYEVDRKTIGAKVDTDNNGTFETLLENEEETVTDREDTSKEQEFTTAKKEDSKQQETTMKKGTSPKEKVSITSKTTDSIVKSIKISFRNVKNIKKKKVKLTWKKVTGSSGYQIQYALNKKFTKSLKKITAKASATTKTIKKLKKKRTYYFRIRAYKNVSSGKVYGKWSKVRKVKINK